MKMKVVNSALLVILVLVMAGCATLESAGHKYVMKGQILEVADNAAYLCVGSRDGAEVGQEFTVYKFIKGINPNTKYAAQPYFKREKAGKIKITEIVDEHMARASIVAGEVKANYFAELE